MPDLERFDEESNRHRTNLPQEKAMCATGGRNMLGDRITQGSEAKMMAPKGLDVGQEDVEVGVCVCSAKF